MPLSRKYPRNSTSFANAGSIIGLGGGGGGLIVGGGRFEPGLRNGFPATPPQENEDKTIKESKGGIAKFLIHLLKNNNKWIGNIYNKWKDNEMNNLTKKIRKNKNSGIESAKWSIFCSNKS